MPGSQSPQPHLEDSSTYRALRPTVNTVSSFSCNFAALPDLLPSVIRQVVHGYSAPLAQLLASFDSFASEFEIIPFLRCCGWPDRILSENFRPFEKLSVTFLHLETPAVAGPNKEAFALLVAVSPSRHTIFVASYRPPDLREDLRQTECTGDHSD